MRRIMANLINVFYFHSDCELPNQDLIPGEVFITGNFKNEFEVEYYEMKKIYIVDITKRLVRVTSICNICNNFHITDEQYHKILGRHWEKYKVVHLCNLYLPITGNCRYFKVIHPESGIGEGGSRIEDFQIMDA